LGKLTAEQKVREYNRGQKAAREGRSRSWSEPWAYPFESDQHYEERREALNQGYGIIDATPCLSGDPLRNNGEAERSAIDLAEYDVERADDRRNIGQHMPAAQEIHRLQMGERRRPDLALKAG
jgi:hypothetical protein